MVTPAVHGGGEADAHGTHAAPVKPSARPSLSPRGASGPETAGRSCSVASRPAGEPGDARSHEQRPVRALERRAERLDGGSFGPAGAGVVGEVVLEREVDDAIGGRGARAQAVEVVEAATVDGRSGGARASRRTASDRASPTTS